MTSHLCTMIIDCVQLYVVFLTVTASVSGIEMRKSPFGPLMCDRLCHHTVDCVDFFYAPQNLTCYLGNTSTALDREALKFAVSKVVGNTFTDISKCPKHSKTYQSRSKKLICFNHNERHNTISSETPCTLKSTEIKTTETTDHVFAFCNKTIGLYHATSHKQLGRVKSIIRQGLEDINCRDKKTKRTPVMAAAKIGERKVFDFLVDQGCLLSGVDYDQYNILHLACSSKNTGIVRKLVVNETFDVESRGFHGRTPIMIAARRGDMETFVFLMNRGSNMKVVDHDNDTILHAACQANVKIVKYILSLNLSGIDVETRGFKGRTPLLMSAWYCNRKMFDFLMNRNSNMKIVDNHNQTILHLACIYDSVKMVKYILSLNISGIDVESRGFKGRTPIMIATQIGSRKVFDFLMNRGSNMKIVDYENKTILDVACHGRQVKMVNHIISLKKLGIRYADISPACREITL